MSMLQSIWDTRIAPSAPVAYAKNVLRRRAREGRGTQRDARGVLQEDRSDARDAQGARGEAPDGAHGAPSRPRIAEARAKIDDAQLFERVKAAYETVLKYPAVVAAVEKATPVAARAVEIGTPYYNKAVEVAGPYVTKVGQRRRAVREADHGPHVPARRLRRR